MRVGIDIHGVADKFPEAFRNLTYNLMANGHGVFIITGQEWKKAKLDVERFKISYTGHFSTVDYHRRIGTKMWRDKNETWWMDKKIWLKSKGDYIKRAHIDVHFDDSYEYARYCPENCTFILVPRKNFKAFGQLIFKGFTLRGKI